MARTIGKGLIEPSVVDPNLILSALIGAICWNLITWYVGLPSSSSHALIGGLGGAAIAKAGLPALQLGGWVLPVSFILVSPLLGLVAGAHPDGGCSRGCSRARRPVRWTGCSGDCSWCPPRSIR